MSISNCVGWAGFDGSFSALPNTDRRDFTVYYYRRPINIVVLGIDKCLPLAIVINRMNVRGSRILTASANLD